MKNFVMLMGSETTEIKLQPGSAITVIMMAGLQGAGKTTTTAKLAGKFKLKGKKPLLGCVRCLPSCSNQAVTDQRGKAGCGSIYNGMKTINRRILQKLQLSMHRRMAIMLVILDTAGRLHIDEDMMAELQEIKNTVRCTSDDSCY